MENALTSSEFSEQKVARALHLLWEYPPYLQGGMGVAAAGLCEALAETMSVDVVLPALEDLPMRQEVEQVNRCYLPIRGSAVLPQAYNTGEDAITEAAEHLYESAMLNANELKESPVVAYAKAVRFAHFTEHDVVHAHDWMTALAGVMMKRESDVPLVFHAHSTHIDRVGGYGKGEVYAHEKWAMQQADCVAVVSEMAKELISNNYEIPLSKIEVVRNGVTDNAAVSDKKLNDIKRTRREKVVMFAGRLVAQKSPEFAVSLMKEVLKKFDGDARCVIAGGGEKLKLIRELVKFKKMENRIEVLGEVPHEKMPILYANADVLIVPSVSEPFGLVAVEAAQAGVAVVMSEQCGAAEVLGSAPRLSVQDFDLWVETVLELLNDDELRQQQVDSQYSEMAECTWKNTAHKMSGVYEQLVQKP